MYILLGTALDGISMIVLTTAIVIPMIKTAGLDPVWFGIFLVLVVEMAEVSPPVGFNLFVLQTMSGKDSNFVALASLPFFFLLVVAVALITVFPEYRDGACRRWRFPVSPERWFHVVEETCIDHGAWWRCCLHSRFRPRRRPNGTCPPPIRPTIRIPSISSPSPRT